MKTKNDDAAMFASAAMLRQRWRDGTFREILEDWKWILHYSRAHGWALALYTFLGLVSTVLGLAGSVASKYLIDIIQGYRTDRIAILFAVMVGSGLTSLAFGSLVNRISARLTLRMTNDIQADVFDRIVDADWLAISGFSNGDILDRFNTDIHTVSSNAVTWLPGIINAVFRFAATFALIGYYDMTMAVIALSSAPFLLVMSRFIASRQRSHNRQMRQSSSRLMTFETEALYNIDTIKSFGAAGIYSGKLRQRQEEYRQAGLKYNLFTISSNIWMSLLGLAVQLVSFGYCLTQLWSGAITFGTMNLFLQQRAGLSSAFNSVVSTVPAFLNSSVSARRIRDLTELPTEIHVPYSNSLDDQADQGFTVELRDLSFAYSGGKDVITDSRLVAKPGEIVALVGPSGEGKTTLIRLILGLVRPRKGRAVITAASGLEVDLNADTRHLFAYVPQGNTILSGTLAENMRMAKADATDGEIIEALKTACAWDFVSQLPDTIHCSVGERGRGLSEGQAQRIAIARAILRDAPVLLLDEATSALDVATERQVLRSIVRSRPNKTCIVTTHRPSVLNMCQRVYRVMDKRVTELSEEESSRMVMEF